ncbi:MAG: homocysteine S-methyltransferase family protein [Acidaminococcaceae bacterium]|jgi:5-methyltetrahydrofolate--homocysteine methyltransferase|nr:homocysteine S-methyltransferase family protein [Acidaminococcaceae bacterium]
MNLQAKLGKEIIFFDGAMGTMLQARGLTAGELPETWNLTHPQVVQAVHEAYVQAGAHIIKTNTFGANALKFTGTDYQVEAIVTAAVNNAKAAGAPWVALDLGPTGKLLQPFGDLPFARAVELYAQVVKAGVAAGADAILIETMSDTYEAKAAILAAKENSSLPVFCTFTFDAGGKLLNGASVSTAFRMAEGLGVDAVGFNCGLGPEQLVKLLPGGAASTSLPLIVNPNAGLPVQQEGRTVYTITPAAFAAFMQDLAQGGAALLGGCCGTTPEHVAALVKAVGSTAVHSRPVETRLTAVTAYGASVVLGKEPILIGERINPTGKKLLKEAIQREDLDYLCRLGLEQVERGVPVLDVNVGIPGTDEVELLPRAVVALQAVTSVPLQLDTSNYAAMAAALRVYNGKPLLNSVNGKEESLTTVLPLAKKYGAVVVALCLDDAGIPATAAGRLAVADKIIKRARLYGIPERDLIIDPLALTISTGDDNAQVDLEVIRALKSQGIKTILGVSNISFGLPARDHINSAFFAAALTAGLSCAIINPRSEVMLGTYHACLALNGLDAGCKNYVAQYADVPKTATTAATAADYNLYDAIVRGLVQPSRQAAKKLVAAGQKPLEIINQYVVPALDYVGGKFEKKEFFLPQLLMSADAAKAGFEVIKAAFAAAAAPAGDVIILATVRGDIHDIGKNIVKALLENYGYRVVDLGKDVPVETIVAAVQKYEARLVGLSALMTTTVTAMAATIAALQQKKLNCKVLVGGAVLTADYAAQIRADAYAPNAIAAVNYANSIFRAE